MPRSNRQKLERLLKKLDTEEREKLVAVAEQIAKGTAKDAGVYGVAEAKRHEEHDSHDPSYTDAARTNGY